MPFQPPMPSSSTRAGQASTCVPVARNIRRRRLLPTPELCDDPPMAEVDVLVTGYVREGTEGDLVEPTISLVRSADVRMVVDPGILRDPSALVSALAERGL